MTLRLSWEEVAALVSKHVATTGLNLGSPRIIEVVVDYSSSQERVVEAAILEFPIITNAPITTENRWVEPVVKDLPAQPEDDPPF